MLTRLENHCITLIVGLLAVCWVTAATGAKPDKPPENTNFAMVYTDYKKGHLSLITFDGENSLQITPSSRKGEDVSPTFSHAGDRIAFLRRPDKDAHPAALYVINSNGTGETLVHDFSNSPLFPMDSHLEDTIAWSPNDSEILFSESYSGGIHAVEVATGTVRQLLDVVFPPADVHVSVARGEIFYSQFVEDQQLYRVPFDDSSGLIAPLSPLDVIQVTNDPGGRSQMGAVSPDGSLLAYHRDRSELVVLDLDTGASWTVLDLFYSESSWSPDGLEIAFQQEISRSGHHGRNLEIMRVNVYTGDIANVTNSFPGEEYQADWKPDWVLLAQ